MGGGQGGSRVRRGWWWWTMTLDDCVFMYIRTCVVVKYLFLWCVRCQKRGFVKEPSVESSFAFHDLLVFCFPTSVNNRGVHFLALQEGEESDVAGLWLLADRQPPKI